MNVLRIIGVTAVCAFCAAHAWAAGGSQSVMDAIERASALVDTSPDDALSLADSIRRHMKPDEADRAALFIVEGNALFSNGENSRAITLLRAAVAASQRARDPKLEIQSLSDLGVMLRVAHKTDSALACYNRALSLIQKHGAPAEDEAALLVSVAILYTNTGRVADAVPFARRAVERIGDSDDIETTMYVCSQAGIIIHKAGHKDEGLDIEKRVVALAERRSIPRYVLKTYASIIEMYHQDGRRDSVDAYLAKGNRLLDDVPQGSVEAIGFLEESYKVLADMGRHRESLEIQKRILDMDDAGTYMPLDKLWLRVARNYGAIGDYRNMQEAYERSIALTESMRASDIDRQLSEFNVRYDTLQKDLTISRLESQRANDRMWLTVWIAICLLTVGAAAVLVMTRRRREALAKIRANLQGVEQERGRLARELHDGVCNDLYGISLLLHTSDTDIPAIAADIDRVRADVRHISHELMPPRFGESDLDELLRTYAARSREFFVYRSEGRPALSEETAYELYRIVQELCSNIVTHSGAESARIDASFSQTGCQISISYSPASDMPENHRGDGIGLDTVRRRAQLIDARIGSRADTDGTHTVTIGI